MKTPAIITAKYIRQRVDAARRELDELAALNAVLRWACPVCFEPFMTQQDANKCCLDQRVNLIGAWRPSERRWYCKTCESSFPHDGRDDAAMCCAAPAPSGSTERSE